MDETIRVLELNIDCYSAKQAMKNSIEYMSSDVLNVVELIPIDTLMYAKDLKGFRQVVEECDMLLPGQVDILESVTVTDKKLIREVEEMTYLKLFLKFLHRNHYRVYLLGDSIEKLEGLKKYISEKYRGIQLVGEMVADGKVSDDDKLVNAINGSEADCIIADLMCPVQEELISRNRMQISAKMWLGVGGVISQISDHLGRKGKISSFLEKLIFKREIRKNLK